MSEEEMLGYQIKQAHIQERRVVRKKIEAMLLVLFPVNKYSDSFRESIVDIFLFPGFLLDDTQKEKIREALEGREDVAQELFTALQDSEEGSADFVEYFKGTVLLPGAIVTKEGIDEATKKTRSERLDKQKNGKLTETDRDVIFRTINYRYDAEKNIHYINDKALFIPEYGDYTIVDYEKDGEYALKNIKDNEKFKQSRKKTGLSYMGTGQIITILQYIAIILGIPYSNFGIAYFRDNAESVDVIRILQAFSMITGFIGNMPLSMTTDREYARVGYLYCFDDEGYGFNSRLCSGVSLGLSPFHGVTDNLSVRDMLNNLQRNFRSNLPNRP